MSVTRERSEIVDAECEKVADAVRSALAQRQASYSYQQTSETAGCREFSAVITPNSWLLLSTRLGIHLQPHGSKTKLMAQTRSQWFIVGDIADFYGGYLRDILASVHSNLGNLDYAARIRHSEPRKLRTALILVTALIVAVVVVYA